MESNEMGNNLLNEMVARDPWELLYNARKMRRYLRIAIAKHDRYLRLKEMQDWDHDEAAYGYKERYKRNKRQRALWCMETKLNEEIKALEKEIYYLENGEHRDYGDPCDMLNDESEDF